MAQILVDNLVKTFRVAERAPGVWGALRGASGGVTARLALWTACRSRSSRGSLSAIRTQRRGQVHHRGHLRWCPTPAAARSLGRAARRPRSQQRSSDTDPALVGRIELRAGGSKLVGYIGPNARGQVHHRQGHLRCIVRQDEQRQTHPVGHEPSSARSSPTPAAARYSAAFGPEGTRSASPTFATSASSSDSGPSLWWDLPVIESFELLRGH